MTSIERKKIEALARKARAVREVWLREREEGLAVQLAANVEVKRCWIESDTTGAGQSQ